MKHILILGAGHVTKPLVDYFIDKCGYAVTMAARTPAKGEKIIAGRPQGKVIVWASNQEDALVRLVRDHDIVVNMIPKASHAMVVKACLECRKHMVSTSYEIPSVKAFDAQAKERGVLILNELGEDPGIDHFVTQMVLDEIRAEGGRILSLKSYGAGLPSFKFNNNPMGYKFSWEPKEVLLAAQVPAAYLMEGKRIEIPGDQLFEGHHLVNIEGLGTFETYPNKDCTRYLKPFGLDENITFYRGLLRFSGYSNNMRNFIRLGLLNNQDKWDFSGQTFRQFAESLIGAEPTFGLEEKYAKFLKVDMKSDIMNRLRWLGLFEDDPISTAIGSRLDVFVELLLKKMRYAPGETDMTIIHVEVIAEFDDHIEKHMATMVHDGTPGGDSAMARCVGLPAAIAVRMILEGELKATGVQMPPMLPQLYHPMLKELAEYGITIKKQTNRLNPTH